MRSARGAPATIGRLWCWVLAAVLLSRAVAALAEPVEQRFVLSGVACHEGSRSVQMAVAALPGVDSVRVMVHAGELIVRFDNDQTSAAAIIDAVAHAAPAGRSGDYHAAPALSPPP